MKLKYDAYRQEVNSQMIVVGVHFGVDKLGCEAKFVKYCWRHDVAPIDAARTIAKQRAGEPSTTFLDGALDYAWTM